MQAVYRLKEDIRNTKWAIILIIACFLFLYLCFGSICPFVCLTGFPCPACGLTRAGFFVITFQFQKAWEMQPFIYPIAFWLAAAAWQRYIRAKKRIGPWLRRTGICLIVSMVLFYIVSMALRFPEETPYIYHKCNLMKHIFALVSLY